MVQDELTKIHNVSLGEASSGSIVLFNQSDTAITVKVTQADFTFNAQNETQYIEPGKFDRSNAEWIRFPASLTVPPNESMPLYYNYQVPNDSDLFGTYWSVLFISEETLYLVEEAEDLYISPRYCVQIVHNINNTGEVNLSFVDTDVTRDSIDLILENTGSRRIDFTVNVDIYDQRAILVGKFLSHKYYIYPGLDRQIIVPIIPLLASDYYAVMIVDCGNNLVFGHQISFTVKWKNFFFFYLLYLL